MTFPRRSVLAAGAAALAMPRVAFAQGASAQAYPSRNVRFICGFPPGSSPDLVARLAGQWLSDTLGQPFVIENRPGAASNIATDAVAHSPADGYTLLMSVLTNVFNTTLYTKLNFNFASDFIHVAGIANAPYVIVVPLSFPAKTVPEFIAYAKANPGKINMASGGTGSSSHIFGEEFKAMAGVDIVHVPYRGNYMPDLMAGEVQMAVNPMPQALELVRSNKIRALAVTTKARQASLPDVPTVAESGLPDYKYDAWFAVMAPAGTPKPILDKVSGDIAKILQIPDVAEKLTRQGVDIVYSTPEKFDAVLKADVERNSAILRAAGVGGQ